MGNCHTELTSNCSFMEEKTKVALVCQPLDNINPSFRNSIAVWGCEVAQRLSRSCEVTLYAKGHLRKKVEYNDEVDYRFVTDFPDRVLLNLFKLFSRLCDAKRPFFSSKLNYFGYILQVALDLKRRQCDIVHIVNFSQFVPIIRALNPSIKIVLHMQCEWLIQLDKDMIEKRLTKTDMIIGCSEYITSGIRKHFPQFADRCQTVFNGADVEHFTVQSKTKDLHANGFKRLLFVGRVSPEKGLHILLDAFEKVIEQYPQTRLEIVGPPWQVRREYIIALTDDDKVSRLASFYESSNGGYLEQLQERLSPRIAEQVIFSGQVPHLQLINHYRDVDIFIHPSVWADPFPLSVLEAMAMGIPVVATQAGGLLESVENGKTGLLVEPGDADALAAAILCILADDDLSESMGKAARERALKLFSWERVAENLMSQYQTLMKNE